MRRVTCSDFRFIWTPARVHNPCPRPIDYKDTKFILNLSGLLTLIPRFQELQMLDDALRHNAFRDDRPGGMLDQPRKVDSCIELLKD